MLPPRVPVSQLMTHPGLETLATQSRWTVSDKDKRPIHLGMLRDQKRIMGLRPDDLSYGCVTLDGVEPILGAPATNYAYRLIASIDRVCVVDIEPGCDPHMRDELFTLEHTYAEMSSSGHGFHLVCPLPSMFSADFPVALKHPSGGFEVLFEHWVTFTGREITLPKPKISTSIDDVCDPLWSAYRLRQSRKTDIAIDLSRIADDVPHAEDMIAYITRFPFQKELSDFPDPHREGDHSRYEYYCLGQLLYRLRSRFTLNPTQQAHIIASALSQMIPHRPKHDTYRDGLPFIVYQAVRIVHDTPQTSSPVGMSPSTKVSHISAPF